MWVWIEPRQKRFNLVWSDGLKNRVQTKPLLALWQSYRNHTWVRCRGKYVRWQHQKHKRDQPLRSTWRGRTDANVPRGKSPGKNVNTSSDKCATLWWHTIEFAIKKWTDLQRIHIHPNTCSSIYCASVLERQLGIAKFLADREADELLKSPGQRCGHCFSTPPSRRCTYI